MPLRCAALRCGVDVNRDLNGAKNMYLKKVDRMFGDSFRFHITTISVFAG